jgi:hypothetical protein
VSFTFGRPGHFRGKTTASPTSASLEHAFLEISKKRATRDAVLRALVSYND